MLGGVKLMRKPLKNLDFATEKSSCVIHGEALIQIIPGLFRLETRSQYLQMSQYLHMTPALTELTDTPR